MKHFAFMATLTLLAGFGALVSPFWPLLFYYGLAILRPQNLWGWALPQGIRWSLIAALLLFVSLGLHSMHLLNLSRINTVAKLLILYGLLLLISVLAAFNPSVAEKWGIEYAKVIVVAFVAGLVITHFWQFRIIAVMTMVLLGYLAWEINFLYFFQSGRLDVFHYGYGGLDNNGAGLMLAMGLPFAAAFFLMRGEDVWWYVRWLAVPLGLFILHAVMMTYSRGAMLAGLVGLTWFGLNHRPRWQSAACAIAGGLVIMTLAGAEIQDRFISTRAYQSDGSAQSRFASWSAAWQLAWDHPISGVGIRNSANYIHQYNADLHGRTIHNQYLQIAADSGIPAAAVYLSMVVLAGWRLRSARLHCLHAWHRAEADNAPAPSITLVQQGAVLFLATECSLLVFAFGGVFLSIELFELPWMLIALGGVAPMIAERLIDRASQWRDAGEEAPSQSPAPSPPTHANHQPHRKAA